MHRSKRRAEFTRHDKEGGTVQHWVCGGVKVGKNTHKSEKKTIAALDWDPKETSI